MTKIGPSVCALLQCTNLGGMEQSAYFIMESIKAKWCIASPRLFGLGRDRLIQIDSRARDVHYRGKYGFISHGEFSRLASEKAVNCSSVWITGTDVACLRVAKNLRLPVLLGHHFHHFDSTFSYPRWKLFYELLTKRRCEITYPTEFTRNEALKICPWLASRSHVVRYHFPVNLVSAHRKALSKQEIGLPPDSFVIGNAGWLIKRKRWDVFIETAVKVSRVVPSSRFVVCGGGPLQLSLQRRVAALQLEDRFFFTGWQSDISKYYAAFDVLLFNSDYDALGRTPGEAMGYGAVPVASVSYGGLSELVKHGVNGFLIDRHDSDALAQFIINLAESPDLKDSLISAGVSTLHQDFSRDAATQFYSSWFGSHA